MKKGIGLFLLSLLFTTQAFSGTSGVLVLRARVPATYSVQIERQGNTLVPVVHSNRARILPKVTLTKKNNLRLVSVVHP